MSQLVGRPVCKCKCSCVSTSESQQDVCPMRRRWNRDGTKKMMQRRNGFQIDWHARAFEDEQVPISIIQFQAVLMDSHRWNANKVEQLDWVGLDRLGLAKVGLFALLVLALVVKDSESTCVMPPGAAHHSAHNLIRS